jgi:hypothetical protein
MRPRLPGFMAENTLPVRPTYVGRLADGRPGREDATVRAAFRVRCSNPVLGGICTALGAPAALFPCFFNSGCMWFHAGLVNPACFSCSFD